MSNIRSTWRSRFSCRRPPGSKSRRRWGCIGTSSAASAGTDWPTGRPSGTTAGSTARGRRAWASDDGSASRCVSAWMWITCSATRCWRRARSTGSGWEGQSVMGTKRLVLTGLLTLLVSAGGVRPVVAQQNPRIAPRDQVSVTVFGVQEFTKKYAVAADGTLEFPELGRLQVSGMTARELGDLIAKRLKEADIVLNPQVAVEVEQTPNKRITVNGSVRSQGVVEFAGEISLLEALVKAGGRMPEAADEVLIYRSAPMQAVPGGADNSRGPTTIEVNAQELENGVMSRNVMLQDGDVVLVRKAQSVTITGFVRSVGAYTVPSGMTVEEALALAGGVSEKGSDRRIEITRKVDGKPTVLKGVKKTDIVKPGDIIKVGPRIM